MPRQIVARERLVELPRLALGDERLRCATRGSGDARMPRGNEDLARREPREQRIELRRASSTIEPNFAGRNVRRGDADAIVPLAAVGVPRHSAQMKLLRAPSSRSSANATPGVTVSITSRRTMPLASLRIFDLLADRDAKALLHEPAHVVARRFHRNAGERHFGRAAVVARRQREAEHARRRFGVVVEHLVELAHAKKQDRVLMATLDLPVLLHERRLRHRRHLSSRADLGDERVDLSSP